MRYRNAILPKVFFVAIAIAGAAVSAWIYCHPRQLPLKECSAIFRQYHKTDGIDGVYIKAYSLNDSVSVPVTVLIAKDSATWMALKADFGKSDLHQKNSHNVITTWMAPKDHYDQPMDSILLNNDILVLSEYWKTIEVFHIQCNEQHKALMKKILYKISNNLSK